jgi:hypothetical protein
MSSDTHEPKFLTRVGSCFGFLHMSFDQAPIGPPLFRTNQARMLR